MLKCGFAQSIITPSLNGTFMDGYGSRLSPAESIRDELYVKVCGFDDGERRFAVISFDLCGLGPRQYRDVAAQISSVSGLPPESFAVCATHTHAGPACGVLADLPLNYDYFCTIGEIAGSAVKTAFENSVAGSFDFRFTEKEFACSHNRRGRPPIDRRIRAASFFDTDGKLRGVIASVACHAVINTNMKISADYPSVLTEEAGKEYPGVPFIFLQGRCGDINPCASSPFGTDEAISIVGHDLADNVLAAVAASGPRAADVKIKSAFGYYTVPMKPYPSADTLKAEIAVYMEKYHLLPPSVEKHCVLRELNWRLSALRSVENGTSPDLKVPIQVFMLSGIAAFIMLPFEPLTLTGNAAEDMAAEHGIPREAIYTVGYANSVNGYLAPKTEIEYGGYEIKDAAHWYGIAECSAESETAVLSAINELICKLL